MKKSTVIYGIILTIFLFIAIVLCDKQQGEIHWVVDAVTSVAIFAMSILVQKYLKKKTNDK